MFLSKKQIDDYENLGAIIIKDVFKDWIEPLRIGFQKVLDKPSKHGRENVYAKEGRLLNHYSWAFYSLTTLVSFSFYTLILIRILKINKFNSYE